MERFTIRRATLWERIKGKIWRWWYRSVANERRVELCKRLDSQPRTYRHIISTPRYE